MIINKGLFLSSFSHYETNSSTSALNPLSRNLYSLSDIVVGLVSYNCGCTSGMDLERLGFRVSLPQPNVIFNSYLYFALFKSEQRFTNVGGGRLSVPSSISVVITGLESMFTTNRTIRIVFPNSIRDYFNRLIFCDYSSNPRILFE
jgi:hypothetical protein